MPLIKGKSPASFEKNLMTEMHHGKPLKQSLAIAYSMKRKAKKMAEGGMTDGQPLPKPEDSNKKTLGSIIKYPSGPSMFDGGAVEEDDKDLNQHMVHEMDEAPEESEGDILERIMSKRKMMSEGGKVANATPLTAGFEPDEFDDLVLRDDLHSTYGEDDNSGDELGNEQEAHDRSDIIARIMRSRAKKDRMPRPA